MKHKEAYVIQDLSEREHLILNRLMAQGTVSVADLSEELAVSEVTVRSDLTNLEELGLLSRTHGGALPSIHPHIFQRQNMHTEENRSRFNSKRRRGFYRSGNYNIFCSSLFKRKTRHFNYHQFDSSL